MPLEAAVERRFKSRGEKLGCWVIKFLPFALAGFPDRIVLADGGRVGFAELKRPGGKLRRLQATRRGRLERMGFLVRVIEDEDGIDEFYRVLLQTRD